MTNKVDCQTINDVDNTAKIYGFYSFQTFESAQTEWHELFEVGSDIKVTRQRNEGDFIAWCNWFFNRLEQAIAEGRQEKLWDSETKRS